jgi:hypothetical protein
MASMSVAVIGSSGGGAATLGHTEPSHLLQVINDELAKIDGESRILHALFVSLHEGKGLDVANPDLDTATLYSIDNEQSNDDHSQYFPRPIHTATLSQVNETCRSMDATIAKAIRNGKVKGLICMSCSIDIHSETLLAAAQMNVPVTGTGGTSLSTAVTRFQIHLVGNAGGSVATSSYTRAVSFAHALATAWGLAYHPFSSSIHFINPQWRSVLNACLPAFWAACLASRFLNMVLKHMDDSDASEWADTIRQLLVAYESFALPTVCCVVMATSCASHHGSTAVMASCIAAMACEKSILGGLLAGWLVSSILGHVLYRCIVWNVPATMTNLVAAGGVGATVAIVVSPLVPFLRKITEWIRWGVHTSMDGSLPGAGFLIGCLFCYGSKVGYYHAICLPIILVEMEHCDASIWGAIDECALVLVSAGICAANLLTLPYSITTDNALCQRAVRINLLYGDFIEAAYPFMERHPLVNAVGYMASGLSTELLARNPKDVLSLAYLPLPMSIWLARDWQRMGLASFTAFGVSFVGTALNNINLQSETQRAVALRRSSAKKSR